MKTIMMLMLCAAFVGCKSTPKIPDLPEIPDWPTNPEEPPDPETPPPSPETPPYGWNDKANRPPPLECAGAPKSIPTGFVHGKDYKTWWVEPDREKGEKWGSWRFAYLGGGTGLYKPREYHSDGSNGDDSRVWIVKGHNPSEVLWAAEVENFDIPHGAIINYATWPSGVGAASNQKIDGHHAMPDDSNSSHYASGGVKYRYMKASKKMATFVSWSRDGRLLGRLMVYDPEVRQQGDGF